MINTKMIIAVVIHVIITLFLLVDSEYPFLFLLPGVIVLLNAIGLLLIKNSKVMLGARIFMISSAILTPIGLIGAMGARQIIDEQKRKEFYNKEK